MLNRLGSAAGLLATQSGGHCQRWLRYAEWGAYAAGCLLLLYAMGTFWRSDARAAQALADFPDMQLWSETRKQRFMEASTSSGASSLGVLRIPRLALSVPIYHAASELNLDLGAAVVDGMAYPHEDGHIGIAGHRDGYFRGLKDLAVGDRLLLDTLSGVKQFRVEELLVVDPDRVDLLSETPDQRLTLVTCYPFYYLGEAPQRMLVRAVPLPAARGIARETNAILSKTILHGVTS